MSVVFVNKHYPGRRKYCSNEQLLREFAGELFVRCAMAISACPSGISARNSLSASTAVIAFKPLLIGKALVGPML